MAIAVGNTTSGGVDGVEDTSWDVTLPTCSVGDLLLIGIEHAAQTDLPNTPTGWTLVDARSADSAAYKSISVFSKEAASGDSGGTVAFTSTTNTGLTWIAMQVTDADTTSVAYDSADQANGFLSSVAFPALTTNDNDLVLRWASHSASTFTAGTGLTVEKTDITSGTNGITVVSDDDDSTGADSGSSVSSSSWSATTTMAIPEAAQAQVISPSKLANTQTFNAPSVSPGAVSVAPSELVNAQSFDAPSVSPGAVTVSPSELTNTQSFDAPSLTPGAVAVSPAELVNAQSFDAPSVDPGAVSVDPDELVNAQSFDPPTVGAPAAVISPETVVSGGRGRVWISS